VDIAISITLLTVLFPVLLFIALIIFVLEGYPVFYISQRYVSLDESVLILKFRTMVRDATSPKYRLKERYMKDGFLDIPLDCEVYTPIGRFLERTQIVEILQLFNVLLHGMSLVGKPTAAAGECHAAAAVHGMGAAVRQPRGAHRALQVVGKLNQIPRDAWNLRHVHPPLQDQGCNVLWCDLFIAYHTFRLLLFKKTLPVEEALQRVSAASRN